MPINWSDQEVKDRLLAAIIASFDGAINCREIARLYGGDATYNAIENFLRKPKAKAKQLKAEAEGRAAPAASPARPRAGKGGKMNGLDGVMTGRVGKTKGTSAGTPKKGIKKEVVDENEEEFEFGGVGGGEGGEVRFEI